MPVSMDEYRVPKWVPMTGVDKATMSRDNEERFYKFETDVRGWKEGFLQPGYNPNHNSTKVENINIDRDSISLKGY